MKILDRLESAPDGRKAEGAANAPRAGQLFPPQPQPEAGSLSPRPNRFVGGPLDAPVGAYAPGTSMDGPAPAVVARRPQVASAFAAAATPRAVIGASTSPVEAAFAEAARGRPSRSMPRSSGSGSTVGSF